MSKHVRTIPAGVNFVETLADGIWEMTDGDTARLSDMRIFLPTRRACVHLRDAFLKRMEAGAALLPRMQPLGDIDDDELYFSEADIDPNIPPAITPLRRKMLLTRLIAARDGAMPYDQAIQLAEALARFLDEAQIMGCDFGKLEKLVETRDLAEHWKQTVEFLKILTDHWPQMLADEGCIDPADRRNRLLRAQATAWHIKPPGFPIIAAGSTGSIPATAELLDAIASMPHGIVILPGLDLSLPEDAWQAVEDAHPQFSMKILLKKFGFERKDVKLWNKMEPTHTLRARLVQESMRPPKVTEEWRHLSTTDIPRKALDGLSRIELDHPQEEAQVISLIMREVLEHPSRTAALVTPDRDLAQRVVATLGRWGVEANDSAGTPLTNYPVGAFLTTLLAAAAPGAGAVDYLSLLKHPIAALGLAPAECRSRARQLEITVWRTEKPEASEWLRQIRDFLRPLTSTWHQKLSMAERIDLHIRLSKQVAASDMETGDERLWRGDDGEAATTWLDDWRAATHDFPPLTGAEYQGLFSELSHTVTVRPRFGQNPRLSILGPLEARLIQADTTILGGLNEGTWPPELPVDPWMSRPMKKDFDLPSPEQRIGLSAHDFEQLVNAPHVIITRARRAGNAPTLPSRFLLQLETVLRALGHIDKEKDALAPTEPWQIWARQLDEPASAPQPCTPPQPRPPTAARPQTLSVTDIGTWQRNPYAIYAKHILKLRKLDPLDADIDDADRGTIIHAILDQFIKKFPDHLPKNALAELTSIGRTAFTVYREHPQTIAFWWPRFERIAAWFVAKERERRADGIKPQKSEASGIIALGTFQLKGRADRIDTMPDGTLAIIDYKTGAAPKIKEVKQGIDPQLSLLALIAEQGGFKNIVASSTSEIAYWKLSGSRTIATIQTIDKDINQLMRDAKDGLEKLIVTFADADVPYEAIPKPSHALRYDDYAHLARLAEWGRTSGE